MLSKNRIFFFNSFLIIIILLEDSSNSITRDTFEPNVNRATCAHDKFNTELSNIVVHWRIHTYGVRIFVHSSGSYARNYAKSSIAFDLTDAFLAVNHENWKEFILWRHIQYFNDIDVIFLPPYSTTNLMCTRIIAMNCVCVCVSLFFSFFLSFFASVCT